MYSGLEMSPKQLGQPGLESSADAFAGTDRDDDGKQNDNAERLIESIHPERTADPGHAESSDNEQAADSETTPNVNSLACADQQHSSEERVEQACKPNVNPPRTSRTAPPRVRPYSERPRSTTLVASNHRLRLGRVECLYDGIVASPIADAQAAELGLHAGDPEVRPGDQPQLIT
jgi:hypothetical protein